MKFKKITKTLVELYESSKENERKKVIDNYIRNNNIDPFTSQDNKSLLTWAVEKKYVEIVDVLLKIEHTLVNFVPKSDDFYSESDVEYDSEDDLEDDSRSLVYDPPLLVLIQCADANNKKEELDILNLFLQYGVNLYVKNELDYSASICSLFHAPWLLESMLEHDDSLIFQHDNASTFSDTFLMQAADIGLIAAVQMILNYYRNTSYINNIDDYLNAQSDEDKETALMIAVKTKHEDVAEFLLDNAANPFLKNFQDKTVLDLAVEVGIPRFVSKLLQLQNAQFSEEALKKALSYAEQKIETYRRVFGMFKQSDIELKKCLHEIILMLKSSIQKREDQKSSSLLQDTRLTGPKIFGK